MGLTYEVWFIRDGLLYEISTYKQLEPWLNDIISTWRFLHATAKPRLAANRAYRATTAYKSLAAVHAASKPSCFRCLRTRGAIVPL